MASSSYKRVPQLLSLLNAPPRECPPPVTSPWFTKLPPDAKLWSKDISLAYNGPGTAYSSFIDNSKKLNLPHELIEAAKSFTLCLSPSDEGSVTKSSVINRNVKAIRIIPPKKNRPPMCEVALAALVKEPLSKKKRSKRVECEQAESSHKNEHLQIVCYELSANQHNDPVNMKKRTKRVKCEQAESSRANEELQMVCYDPIRANQHNEPDKKKRRVSPKIESGPVVKNEVTEELQKFITDELNGSDLTLVIQKVLYMSDLAPGQNRLLLPQKQLITEDFLSEDERWILESDGEIDVGLVGPTLKMFKGPMGFKMWRMTRSYNYVLKTNWNHFVEENKEYLKEHSKIQLWSFRKDQQLCFALAVVDIPPLYLMA